jgi:transketolase
MSRIPVSWRCGSGCGPCGWSRRRGSVIWARRCPRPSRWPRCSPARDPAWTGSSARRGHYIIGPFAAAAELGLIDLSGYGQNGSAFEAIGTERSPVVDYTCGSLGQGLSAAAGFALADRFRGSDARIFTMVSDGELEEGQVWEAALFAAHHHLDRLVVLLDANNSQVDGPVDSITTLEPIAAKWSAFGWQVVDLDGHDVSALRTALDVASAPASAGRGRPSVLVCRTSTRHGLDCLPPEVDGHFIKLPPDLFAAAVRELTGRLEALRA